MSTGIQVCGEWVPTPTECPRCHRSIVATFDGGSSRCNDEGEDWIDAVFRCPSFGCGLFLVRYELNYPAHQYEIAEACPTKPRSLAVPAEVVAVSPSFHEVFTQASLAADLGLVQVAGCGYRKALEVLVKDYCIRTHPDKRDAIVKCTLGWCIAELLGSGNVKRCAELASWLGNDAIHYDRKWKDHDLGDLKRLLQLTINWIHDEEVTQAYDAQMSYGPPSA